MLCYLSGISPPNNICKDTQNYIKNTTLTVKIKEICGFSQLESWRKSNKYGKKRNDEVQLFESKFSEFTHQIQ